MKIAASFLGLLACMCGAASGADRPVIACNTKAISAAERPRYNALVGRLRRSIRDRRELPDGYAFRLNEQTITLTDVAEWIRMERLCCPFLVFQIEVSGTKQNVQLTLRGPSGTKAILESAFQP
jgi:hypothetical protein